MIEMFKLNGEIYCKLFAWTPVRTTSNDASGYGLTTIIYAWLGTVAGLLL
jgi:hypothetical protein